MNAQTRQMTQDFAALAQKNIDCLSQNDLVNVSRAVADLRRGEIVIVTSVDENATGYAVGLIATEPLSDAGLKELCSIGDTSQRATLVIPRVRARALGGIYDNSSDPDYFVGFEPKEIANENAHYLTELANPLLAVPDQPVGNWRQANLAEYAGIRLAKLARLLPATVTVPIDFQKVDEIAKDRNLIVLVAEQVNGYENASAASLKEVSRAEVPLENAENATVVAFRPDDGGQEHLAIIIDAPVHDQPVLVRLHSECFTGDLLGSLRCDCGPQLRGAISEISKRGQGGIILYLRQEGRGIGLVNKLRAYALQDRGFDTLDANEELGFDADERVYRPAAEMLRQLGFESIMLLTNNPKKMSGLENLGIHVVSRVPHTFPSNGHNEFYLATKKNRAGHLF